MSNPIKEMVLGIVRHLLTIAGGVLIKDGLAVPGAFSPELIAGLAAALVGVGWSIYQKYHGRQKLLTAQVTPAGKTEREIEAIVNAGQAPPINTPKNEVPA